MKVLRACGLSMLCVGILACQQSVEEGLLDGAVELDVSYGETSRKVELGQFVEASKADEVLVPLSEVVAAAWPELAQDGLLVDFVASDGFRPASRSNCVELIPIDGALLAQGQVHALTGNLLWDESLGFPGCLQLSDLGRILLSDSGSAGRLLRFVLAGAERTVDLSFQPGEDVAGQALVNLAAVVAASGISESPELYDYDFEGADGSRPALDREAAPLDYATLALGWIDPVGGDLSWDASLALSGFWSVGDCAAVHLLEQQQPAAAVEVVYGEQSVEVDLGELEAETVEGEELIALDAIVTAAALVQEPALFHYDFEGADGFRPSVDRQAEPLAYASLESGWMHPVSRNLSWDAALNLSGWWSVADTARIHLLDP